MLYTLMTTEREQWIDDDSDFDSVTKGTSSSTIKKTETYLY
jgi:hypothetical protein